jgi:N-acetylmuramoyl-L-alanine amidase
VASACHEEPANSATELGQEPAVPEPADGEVSGGRFSLIAQADQLAMRAQGKPDAEAGPLLLEAATLRERAYRRELKRVDALEAIELLTVAARLQWSGACEGGVRAGLLRGELNASPEQTYKDVYVVSRREPTQRCREQAEAALATLTSFRPEESVLEALLAEDTTAAAAPASPAPVHDSHVVVPELLEKTLAQPSTITRVESYGAEDTARIVVHLSHPTRFQVGILEGGAGQDPRLFVDVSKATYKGQRQFDVGGLVRRTRLGQQEGGTRVVLDLARPVYHRVFYLPEPFRLVIDVSREPPERVAAPRAIQRVVLDPGHGGNDPGALGPNGLREKDVTLDVAHRAAPLLAREIGVSTLLTRDTDVYVPLDERAARANAFNADIFVSIHCNASENAEQRGVMTFVLDASKDSLAARVAARENASTEAAAAELANALSRVTNSERLAASEHFAGLLQRAASASLGHRYDQVRDHGVRRAGFYVLAGAHMPSVLFEGSFISNYEEARRLNQGDYRQRLADAIVNAVRAYREGR